MNNQTVYRSKTIFCNLNPVWNEEFKIRLPKKANNSDDKISNNNFKQASIKSNDIGISFEKSKLVMNIFDYDRGFSDDFIGYANIDFALLKENMYEGYLSINDRF